MVVHNNNAYMIMEEEGIWDYTFGQTPTHQIKIDQLPCKVGDGTSQKVRQFTFQPGESVTVGGKSLIFFTKANGGSVYKWQHE